MLPHWFLSLVQAILASALFHALSGSDFGVEVSHDNVVVSLAIGENVGNVFMYLLCLLIRVATDVKEQVLMVCLVWVYDGLLCILN